jgi:hypothetical protein
MRLLAEFNPPDALQRLDEWKATWSDAIEAVSDDSLRIDMGRALDGRTFVRVWLLDERVSSVFASSRPPQ